MTKTNKTTTINTIANEATPVETMRTDAARAIFNIEAALAAATATPMCVRAHGTNGESRLGQVKARILEVAKAINAPFSLNQLDAALKAGGFEPKGRKELADVCWGLWKKGQLKKGDSAGIYEIA